MKVAVDISLYPLQTEFLAPIKDVVERLHGYDDVEVWTNAMSTQLVGEFATVMEVLEKEIGTTFDTVPKAVFTIRILNNPGTYED